MNLVARFIDEWRNVHPLQYIRLTLNMPSAVAGARITHEGDDGTIIGATKTRLLLVQWDDPRRGRMPAPVDPQHVHFIK